MPRNIEIKARISSVEELMPKVRSIADQGPWELRQEDTYFECAAGRLKLRTGSEHPGQLIYYRRENQAGPKESLYTIAPTSDPKALRALLSQALGQVGRVEKVRTLFLSGRTRIHLDRVAGLGDFLELEVVLADQEPAGQGIEEAHELLSRLGIHRSQLIEGSYLEFPASSRMA
ncbi:MAG: class IV adenylate cyclase [Proteobacteria bacterium]|nr:class IV adenylate cyclase [Pseudomonadota bacterium]